MSDKQLTCRDCGANFVFTEGEQEFYASRGLMNEPSRCPSCRAARKAESRGGSVGGYSRGPREMHQVICAQCGKETEVPFLPTSDRPVYCSDCYRAQRPSSGNSNSRGRRW